MKRLDNSQVQFRSREASPVTYTVAIPLAELTLASLGVAVLMGLLSTLGGADIAGAVKTGGIVFVVLTAILLAVRFGKSVLWVEKATGRDWDMDGEVGEPEPRFVYVRRGQGRNSHNNDLRDFLQGCYTRGTGRRAWVGSRLAGTGHTVTRGTYDRFCGVLLSAGILEDLGGGRGKELVCSLDEAMETLGLE